MKTHYDVLNLNKSCSSKEIKESFVNLSKLYHPDINKSCDAHKKFIEINEAYSVLGKPDTRRKYDDSLSFERKNVVRARPGPSAQNVAHNPHDYYYHIYTRNGWQNPETTNSHFFNSKVKVLVFCCLLMLIGSGMRLRAEIKRKKVPNEEVALYLKENKERRKLTIEEIEHGFNAARFKNKKKAGLEK